MNPFQRTFFCIRPLVTFAIILATACSSFAQDSIYTVKGHVIVCNVKTASKFFVCYSRVGKQNSWLLTIPGNLVERVVYADGRRWSRRPAHVQEKRDREAQELKLRKSEAALRAAIAPPSYGRNIIAVAPIAGTAEISDNSSIPPNMLGVQYERFINANKSFSFVLPLTFSFFMMDELHGVEGYQKNLKGSFFTQLNPGVKFYPFGSNHKAAYGVGPALGIGIGRRPNYLRDAQGISTDTLVNEKYNRLAFLLTNSFTVAPHPSFYFGIDLNAGFSFEKAAIEPGFEHFSYKGPFVQFLVKFGYRF